MCANHSFASSLSIINVPWLNRVFQTLTDSIVKEIEVDVWKMGTEMFYLLIVFKEWLLECTALTSPEFKHNSLHIRGWMIMHLCVFVCADLRRPEDERSTGHHKADSDTQFVRNFICFLAA